MKTTFYKFIFPVRNPIFAIAIAGLLVGLRLVSGLFAINVGPMIISFNWTTIFLIGFILGPLFGFVIGWITNSLDWVIHGDIWMWEYAIQEPLICLLGGLLGILYKVLKDHKSKWTMFILFEVVFTGMMIFGLYVVSKYFDFNGYKTNNTFTNMTVKISGIVLISAFYIGINILVIIMMKRNNDANLIMAVSLLVIITTVIFSWLMGPWAMKRWFEYQYGHTPIEFTNYGYKYYALSRIVEAMFIVPVEITLVYPLWKAYLLWSKRSQTVSSW